jgi:DNA-binding MarR family transcriptional regulator
MARSPRDPDYHLGFLLHDVARLRSTAFDHLMKPLGITRAQWVVLGVLYREDGVTQADLAKRMDLGRVSLGGIIDRLEAAGWVRRSQDLQDRRANRVWLTEKVVDVRRQMQRRVDTLNEISLAGLDESRIDELVDTLNTIKRNLIAAENERKL